MMTREQQLIQHVIDGGSIHATRKDLLNSDADRYWLTVSIVNTGHRFAGVIDCYYPVGLYGEDISDQSKTFDSIHDAIEFAVSLSGIPLAQFEE